MSKVNKKVIDAELSSSEEEVVQKKAKGVVEKKQKKPKVKGSDESSDDSIVVMKGKSQRKESDKAKAPGKKKKVSEDKSEEQSKKKKVVAKKEEDSDDEDVKPKKTILAAKLVPAQKVPVKMKESSDEEDSDDEDVKPKKTIPAIKLVPAKKAPVKKEESSDEEDSDDDANPKKTVLAAKLVPRKKAQVKKKESSDDDDSEEEVKPKVAPVKKAPIKKQESSDNDDSDEEDVKPKVAPKKAPAKKEDSSSDDEDEKEVKTKVVPTKKVSVKKQESSDDDNDDSDEMEKPQKQNPKEKESTDLPAEAYEELFVRNLSYNTIEETLAEHLGKYGDIELVKIIKDKMTNKSKGFGFVKFYEKASAVAAMKDADNINVDGRTIQIRYSNDNSQRQSNQGNQGNQGYQGGSYQKSNYAGEKHAIFVGNLSWKTNENSIKKYFSDCGNVVDIRIAKQPDGKMKGFAHVDFDSLEAVDNALKKNGIEFEGRALKVDRSTPRQGGGAPRGRGGYNREGFGGGDSISKARKTGAMIMPTESKVVDLDDDE